MAPTGRLYSAKFESGWGLCSSYGCSGKVACMKLKISLVLLVALAPAVALASQRTPAPVSVSQRTPTAHLRPQLYHDRTPKAHVHESLPHHA
jgi:hypothetical protein